MALFGTGNFSSSLSTLTSEASWGSADAASELSLLTGSASIGVPWEVSLTFRVLDSVGYDFYGSADSTISYFTGVGSGITGADGSAASTLSLLTGQGAGERGWYGVGDLSVLSSEATAYLNIAFDGALELSLLRGTAFIQAILTDTYQTWCVEAKTNAHTEYDNFGFNSFGTFHGVTLGANENGIYSMGGEDDDGTDIDAEYFHAVTDFSSPGIEWGLSEERSTRLKRMFAAYLSIRDGGQVQFLLKIDEDKYRVYDVDTTNDPEGMHLKLIRTLGRNLTGTFWQPGIKNVDGSDFEIESIKLYPVVLSRRVK